MTLTDEQLADIAKRPDFLLKAAQYFRKRPTGGEDRAHWANVYNAENCEKMAMEFRALLDEVERLRLYIREITTTKPANKPTFDAGPYWGNSGGSPGTELSDASMKKWKRNHD